MPAGPAATAITGDVTPAAVRSTARTQIKGRVAMTKSMAIPAVILALVLVGCARQPTTTQGAAPSPDGGVGMRVMTPDGMKPANGTSDGRSMSGTGANRPSLEGFKSAAELRDIH